MVSAPSNDVERSRAAVLHALDEVCDPEIPNLTIADLGILRDVRVNADHVVVVITPSYSGCPAMDTIERDVITALNRAGFREVAVETQLAPAWTSEWLTARGREKLLECGIAPPVSPVASVRALHGGELKVACPRCASTDTEQISEFGSTACKALHRCRSCLEPFDYFKCI